MDIGANKTIIDGVDLLSQGGTRSRYPKVTLDIRDQPTPTGQDAIRVEPYIPPKEEEVPLPHLAGNSVHTGERGVI